MKLFASLSLRSFLIGSAFLIALLAGTGPLAFGQETIQGTMKLSVAARLGSTVLPAGEYRLSVSMLGGTHSLSDVQVASHVAVLVTGMSKNAPTASVIATAFRSTPNSPKPVNFASFSDGLAIHSIALDSYGVVIKFYETGAKTTLRAGVSPASSTMMAAKAND
ncbi:MAG TPA: hypothetical protein VL128_13695 [Candidatus Eisenbacteria bacterium]|nr:hypothetical protein [Candidatus Eisenbacteria bacterium]